MIRESHATFCKLTITKNERHFAWFKFNKFLLILHILIAMWNNCDIEVCMELSPLSVKHTRHDSLSIQKSSCKYYDTFHIFGIQYIQICIIKPCSEVRLWVLIHNQLQVYLINEWFSYRQNDLNRETHMGMTLSRVIARVIDHNKDNHCCINGTGTYILTTSYNKTKLERYNMMSKCYLNHYLF